MTDLGTVTQALLELARDDADDRDLACRICQACLDGLDVDGAAISLLTASVSRETLWATDATAELLEDLQFTLNEGACMEAATTGTPVLVPDLHHGSEVGPLADLRGRGRRADPGGCAVRAAAAVGRGQSRGAGSVPDRPRRAQRRSVARRPGAADMAALMMLGLRTDPGEAGGGWLDPALGSIAPRSIRPPGWCWSSSGISATDALGLLRATRSSTSGCSSTSPATSSLDGWCSPRT